MQQKGSNTAIRLFLGRLLLTGLLFFAPTGLPAQSVEDSTVLVEEGVNEPPDEYKELADTAVSIEQEKRFLKKEETDSFSVNERDLPPGYGKKLKEDKDFWYADADVRKKDKKKMEEAGRGYIPLGQRPWVQTLLWIFIIGGFAGAIMWYLADSNIGLFRKRTVAVAGGTETDEMPEDIFAINYQKEIDKAVARANYRMAVRMMFLRLLKNLSDKNLIRYKQDKTNFDYLMELSAASYYPSFFRLTRHFEYSWYGQFDVPEETYRVIAAAFDEFEKQIR